MTTKIPYETDTLFDIFNDINTTIINNNLCMKDKIIKKIDIIKKLSNSNIDVLNYNNDKKENLFNILKSLNYKLMSVKKNQNKLNTKLNTILGVIIHNAYISAGYQVLLSNIPNRAKQVVDNKLNTIDIESIYDTVEHYIGKNSVINVIQIDNDKYLIKFKDNDNNSSGHGSGHSSGNGSNSDKDKDINNDAKKLCHLIHNMMIEPNIIRAEILEHNTLETIDIDAYFENKITYSEKEKEKETNKTINDSDICDYGISKLDKSSLFSICINLGYKKYKYIEEKIKNNVNYILSFFYKSDVYMV